MGQGEMYLLLSSKKLWHIYNKKVIYYPIRLKLITNTLDVQNMRCDYARTINK